MRPMPEVVASEASTLQVEPAPMRLDLRQRKMSSTDSPAALAIADWLVMRLARLSEAYPTALGSIQCTGTQVAIELRCPPNATFPRFGMWLEQCDRQHQLARLFAAHLEKRSNILVDVEELRAECIEVSITDTSRDAVECFVDHLESGLEALSRRRSDLLLQHLAETALPMVVAHARQQSIARSSEAIDAAIGVLYVPRDLQTLARLDESLLAYDDQAATAVGQTLAGWLDPFVLDARVLAIGRKHLRLDRVCLPGMLRTVGHCEIAAMLKVGEDLVQAPRGGKTVTPVVWCPTTRRRIAATTVRAIEPGSAFDIAKWVLRRLVDEVVMPQLAGYPLTFEIIGADASTESELQAHWNRPLQQNSPHEPSPIEVIVLFPDVPPTAIEARANTVVLDVFGTAQWQLTPDFLKSNILYVIGADLQVREGPLESTDLHNKGHLDPEILLAVVRQAADLPAQALVNEALLDELGLQIVTLRSFWGDLCSAQWRAFTARRKHPCSIDREQEVTIFNPALVYPEGGAINLCEQILCASHLRSTSVLIAPTTGQAAPYTELRRLASAFAQRCQTLGLETGDVVAVAAPDSVATIAVLLGCWLGGWVFAPLNFYAGAHIPAMLDAAQPKLVLYDQNCSPSLATVHGTRTGDLYSFVAASQTDAALPDFIPARLSPESPAVILFTSGSTGTPKAVVHSHNDLLECGRNYSSYVLGLTQADRVHTPSPTFFAYGLHNLTLSLLAGATHVLAAPRSSGLSVAEILARFDITVLLSVPAVYKLLLANVERTQRFSSLRLCVSAGEKLPAQLYAEIVEVLGIEPLDGIGCTEALSTFISNRSGCVSPNCTGVLIPGFAVKLLNEQGKLCKIGEVGTLWLRGEALTRSYMTDPVLTSRYFVDGWFNTRDMFYCDFDYRFYNVGRSGSIIKINACWFSPETVEAVLQSHPTVKECVVSIVYDGFNLPRPKAFVVLNDADVTEPDLEQLWNELRALCRTQLGKDNYPHMFTRIDNVPRTASGKTMRPAPARA